MPDAPERQFDQDIDPGTERPRIEPWLSAMFQTEHLSLLLGSGFTTGIAHALGATPTTMAPLTLAAPQADKVDAAARRSAQRMRRGEPNFEDQLRAARELRDGAAILEDASLTSEWNKAIAAALSGLVTTLMKTENEISTKLAESAAAGTLDVLSAFLLAFASRSSSRDRLTIFTTNYDRLIELGCERIGVRLMDHFVGSLRPWFRSSRLELDIHYNPPGVRGEPRPLEGVARFAKLHGSLDWRFDSDAVRRDPIPFGGPADVSATGEAVVIYPNASKDVETSAYPYSELFRDFSAAICRPNSVLVTYGYGFGDHHINTIIRDMLTIPSTHLVIIGYNDASGRIPRFVLECLQREQISYLVGDHFGEIKTLTGHYLPTAAIDRLSLARVQVLRNRELPDPRTTETEQNAEKDGGVASTPESR